MHLLRTDQRSLDEAAPAIDLDQTPAEIVFLSFTDSDLSSFAAAHDRQRHGSLRLASLAQLKHPYSVDLHLEKTCARARFVLVRLLGGADYWRYGVDELAAAARSAGFKLAIVPGDELNDPRLDDASTVSREELRRIHAYFQQGGVDNLAACLDFIGAALGGPHAAAAPRRLDDFGEFAPARIARGEGRGRALIVFYRSARLAEDVEPILALSHALSARGLDVDAVFVTSLKDPGVEAPLSRFIAERPPDVILNATSFSARRDDGGGLLDLADAPVLQVVLAGSNLEQWSSSTRGLSPADLAMNVVLPEIDGRIVSRAISFKAEHSRDETLEFSRLIHRSEPSRVDFTASLAAAWASLRRKPRLQRALALILSDYPAKAGRTGYAVGLDTPQSAVVIARALRDAGYDIGPIPSAQDAIAQLTSGAFEPTIALSDYERRLAELPSAFVEAVRTAWGAAADDPSCVAGIFHFRLLRLGKLIIAVQPDRGRAESRKSEFHDPALPPRHGYVAFYLWLREVERVDAMIHCGAHGTLEWLPGKAVALSSGCAPEVVLGPTPLVYPFIVNNPGEAAQAKRRVAATIISHLTPPLVAAGVSGATAELESLFDEYAQAQTLDRHRAQLIADLILQKARESGLLEDCGGEHADDPLLALDSWLCDVKDMRIADGLHVFGCSPQGALRDAAVEGLVEASGAERECVCDLIEACGAAEIKSLLKALDGRFIEPGPSGAPTSGRLDSLPTGRNIYGVDPRAVPTRTAWEIGRRIAQDVLTRHMQDQGDWPKRVVLDLWGSATMRTGGQDLGQAFALLGVRPLWDHASTRVTGFEILPIAALGRPRVDVALRISGLFRDVFPTQIALFDMAVRAVAALDEDLVDNPLVAASDTRRIFGAAPGRYGIGLNDLLSSRTWTCRDDLGQAYLDSTSHSYGTDGLGEDANGSFARLVAATDAFVHTQDMAGQDVLEFDAFAEHEGGFFAAAAMAEARPAIYHVDATRPDRIRVRTGAEEVGRALRARAINPRWLSGQMRHGHRGAAEIAQTVDNLFAFSALTDFASSRHFDLLFDAVCADDEVRAFLIAANPQAADAIAKTFEEAALRGYWTSRSNSAQALLADMRSHV